ncbi:MAG: hypothetical protein LQ350_006207 [Teloschistes chrysophthalmus]|nr:MAG: hypothetical protein LQ350_006207 [Niorma chrysophthalma]
MPNLKSINLFGVEHSDTGNFAHIMNDSQFSVMQALFSSAKLREISFHNFSQALPWLDLVSNSGSTLQQLSMHTWPYHWGWAHFRRLPPKSGPVPSWRDPQIRYLELDEQSGSTYGIQYLQLDQQPGFTYAELLRLSSLCPNIEKLGFDIHGMGVEDAHSTYLNALAAFPKLRHLILFFHPIPPAEEVDGRDARWSLQETPLPADALLDLFHGLNNRKRGTMVESITYRTNGRDEQPWKMCRM